MPLPMRFALSLIGPLVFVVAGSPAIANTDCAVTAAFPDTSLDDWQIRRFAGNTDYSLVRMDDRPVLEAHSRGAASILYRERDVDIGARPHLSWSWRVDGVYEGLDEMTRDGDDFPARMYVVAKTGFLPWETLALNYVWASEAPVGSDWISPYTDKSRMIAVRSGSDDTGQWVCQTRNVVADFRAAFGVEIDEIAGYAVMVDGDDSGREGLAWFGDIAFSP